MKTLMIPAMFSAMMLVASTSATAASRQLSVRALTMAGDFPGEEVFAHSVGSKEPGVKLKVKNFLNHEFDSVSLVGDSLILTNTSEASSAANKFALLGQVKVPDDLTSGILLFLPGDKKGSGSVTLIADGKAVFPPGSTLIFNSTRSEMRLEIAGKNYDVKAGGNLVIRDQPSGDDHSSTAKGFVKTDGKWVQFSSAIWPHPGTKRVLQVACEDARTGKADLRDIKDVSAAR